MPKVYRVSLVRMYYCTDKDKRTRDTPTPFCELRAFMFLRKIPNQRQRIRIREFLASQLDELENIIESIGEQKRAGLIAEWFDPKLRNDYEIDNPKEISLTVPTKNVKVMIEGFEVEQIDLESIFEYRLGGRDHRFFTTKTETAIMEYNNFLNIGFNSPQRYFALFNENGEIRQPEYDEANIKQTLIPKQEERRRIVATEEEFINKLRERIKKADFQKSINDLLRIIERQKKIRGEI